MSSNTFDVARARGLYPTVGAGTAHLEGALSAVQPESVIRAIIATLRLAPSQPGSRSARSQRAGRSAQQARQAVADLVGAAPESVILGTSQADLTLRFAALVSVDWQLGDEIVLSRLDSDLLLHSWLGVARAKAAVVRWAEVDLETGELPAWQYDQLIGRHTRIVTVPLGNPTTGTVPDIPAIAELAHAHGALVVVDAGSALTHLPVSLEALGADLVTFAASAIGGPTVAALAARPGLLLEITGDAHPPAQQRLEVGPLPVELLDGLTAAIDHLAGLAEPPDGPRRGRILASVNAIGDHTADLYAHLDGGLRALPAVTVLGTCSDRLPVLAFTVAGRHPAQVGDELARQGIAVWTGPTHMSELMSALGTDEIGGAVHVGLMPHTNRAEVQRLIAAVSQLA